MVTNRLCGEGGLLYGATTFSITTFRITTLSIMGSFATFSTSELIFIIIVVVPTSWYKQVMGNSWEIHKKVIKGHKFENKTKAVNVIRMALTVQKIWDNFFTKKLNRFFLNDKSAKSTNVTICDSEQELKNILRTS
jgi:hypothetical protein